MAYGPGESRFVEEKRHFEKPIPISDARAARPRALHPLRPLHPVRQGGGRRPADPLHRPRQRDRRSTRSPTTRSPPTSAATPCRSARWARSPRRRTASRPARGTSSRSSRPARRARSAAASSCSRAATRCCATWASTVDPVNWGWLCDKGRFDFEAVNSEDRLGAPLVRDARPVARAGHAGPRRCAGSPPQSREGLDRSGPSGLAVLGGARLTNEDAYAWAKLAKGVIGTDNVDAQLGDGLPAEVVLGLPRATIDDACRPGGTVLLLGPDLKEELPVLYLRLRHAVAERRRQGRRAGPDRHRPDRRAGRRVAALPARRGRCRSSGR